MCNLSWPRKGSLFTGIARGISGGHFFGSGMLFSMMTRHFMKKSSLIDSPIERESLDLTEARQHLAMSHCMQTKPLAKCMRQCLASGTFG